MEDSEISPEISITLGQTIEGFQECVEDVIEEIDEDGHFSKMTAESYDRKKWYLRIHLNELTRFNRLLADQYIHLIEEVSKNCPYLLKKAYQHPSDSASTSSSAVKDDALKLKDVITEKSRLEVAEAKVVELQNEVAYLHQVISELNLKIKTLEEEVEMYKKKLSIANDLIRNLKGEPSSNIFQENRKLQQELDKAQNKVHSAHDYLVSRARSLGEMNEQVQLLIAAQIESNDKTIKLETKNERYKSDITRLEETLKSKEDIWNQDVAKLKGQLKNQTKSSEDLKKQLVFSRSERNRISRRLESLKEEKASKDKLIQELETRLNAFQVERERIVSSFEDAEKIQTELTLKMIDLQIEVDCQKEVIADTTKEKIDAIRELSFSLEHYMTKYKQLRQSYAAANKAGCFDFLSGLNTQ